LLLPASDAEVHALWRGGILAWKLWQQQLRIYNIIRSLPLHVQIVVLLLARQFGKSVLSIVMAVEDCIQNPGVIVVIIAPKVDQAIDIVSPRMKWLTRDAPKGLIRPLKSENTWLFSNESELKLGGYSSAAVSQRGKTLHKVILEEFGPDTDADGYLDFLRSDVGPALMHSKNAQLIFPTTLPKMPDHPFITETIPEAQLHGAYFEFTIDDNEALSPEQKAAAIKLAGGRGSIDCERELYCKSVRDPSVVVLPPYDDKRHASTPFELPRYFLPQITIDWGGVKDKTVALWHTHDFFSDMDLVFDELVWDPNTPSKVIVPALRERDEYWRDLVYGADPWPVAPEWVADLPGQTRVDLEQSFKFPTRPPPKEDWQSGVNQMQVRCSQDKLRIHPRCKFLRLSCRSGTFNKQKTDFARTKTLGHMDALAALMYALRTQNRANPWPDQLASRDQYFKRQDPPTEEERIAKAIQPKSFGPDPGKGFQPKKFGKFKR